MARNKNFLFFNLIPKSVFGSIIGLFLLLFLLFLSLSFTLTIRIFFMISYFFLLGTIVFTISFFIYWAKYFSVLKIPSYKAYIISRNKLIKWVIFTINVVFLLFWYSLIISGDRNGLGITFPNSQHVSIFTTTNSYVLKTQGIILWSVHISLLFLFYLIKNYIKNLFTFAHKTLSLKRQKIKDMRENAKVVYQE